MGDESHTAREQACLRLGQWKTKSTRTRFYNDGHWGPEQLPPSRMFVDRMLEEILDFVRKRLPEDQGYWGLQRTTTPLDKNTAGTWFKLVVGIHQMDCAQIPDQERGLDKWTDGWHATNMYAWRSCMSGLFAYPGTRSDEDGQPAVYLHKTSSCHSCQSYMWYVASGSGAAWGVLLHCLVNRREALKNAGDQWRQRAGRNSVRICEVFFHGVPRDEWWNGMHIWGTWSPKKELKWPGFPALPVILHD